MELPLYYDLLTRIRNALENTHFPHGRSKFPKNRCDIASEIVKRELGLHHMSGIYDPYGGRVAHNWNYDKELGLYIDLTMDQFNILYHRNHDQVMVLDYETPLLQASSFVTLDEDWMFYEQIMEEIEAFEAVYRMA